jgi:hypothetical protein
VNRLVLIDVFKNLGDQFIALEIRELTQLG